MNGREMGMLGVAALLGVACHREVPRPDAGRDAAPQDAMADSASVEVPQPGDLRLERLWPADRASAVELAGGIYASPQLVESRGQRYVLAFGAHGQIAAFDPAQGALAWSVQLEAPEGTRPLLIAPPVRVGQSLVVGYQTERLDTLERTSHRVVVVDLAARRLDPGYAPLVLAASRPAVDGRGQVTFNPPTQLSRSPLLHVRTPDGRDKVYQGFGNAMDIQPWHGWVFEIDLGLWRERGAAAAVQAVLLTTPEVDCGEPGVSGGTDMICGGGVWAPAGVRAFATADGGYELIVPTGNGQLDLARHDYANALLRVGPGLRFDPGCDPAACANFDPIHPAEACLASCRDLFVPRLRPGDPPLRPGTGVCDGKTFLECYARLDFDLGANTPARVDVGGGRQALLLPAKDGAVYLLDYAHLGRMYDRLQVTDLCGTREQPCWGDWMGTFVTEPVVTEVDGAQVALMPSFMPDPVHAAGVVAVRIERGERPSLRRLWTAPEFGSTESRTRFRFHPSRLALVTHGAEPYAFVVDANVDLGPQHHGTVLGVRVRDGRIVARQALLGNGMKYTTPLVLDDNVLVFVSSHRDAPGFLEAYRIARVE